MEPQYYWLCFGGAGLVGASASDLEPTIIFGTSTEANDVALDMCINAHDSYGPDDDEEESGIEEEYSDCYVEKLFQTQVVNWGLWDTLKALVKERDHNWDEVKEQYGLFED